MKKLLLGTFLIVAFAADFFHQSRGGNIAGQLRNNHHQHIFKGFDHVLISSSRLFRIYDLASTFSHHGRRHR